MTVPIHVPNLPAPVLNVGVALLRSQFTTIDDVGRLTLLHDYGVTSKAL